MARETKNEQKKEVAVIGGGIAGCMAALQLAKDDYRVTLFERNPKRLMSGSSDATPCRLGIGFHYPHHETALHNLRTAIQFIRLLKAETVTSPYLLEPKGPEEKIHYAIAKESTVPDEDVDALFKAIRTEYETLIKADPDNKVLGEPEDLYHLLDEIPSHINREQVSRVFETAEPIVDWPNLRPYIIGKILDNPNIDVLFNTDVTNIKPAEDFSEASITFQDFERPAQESRRGRGNKSQTQVFDLVVNASWQNASRLEETAGIKTDKKIVNRVKCMAKVKLPEELAGSSTLIGYGPFAAMTSRGDDGCITFEPVTNVEQFKANEPETSEEKGYTQRDLSQNDGCGEIERLIALEILKGAAKWFPALAYIDPHQITGFRHGVVRTDEGEVDISDPTSDKFKRTYNGVSSKNPCVITDEARKLIYGVPNGAQVRAIANASQALLDFTKSIEERSKRILFRQALHDTLIQSHVEQKKEPVSVDDTVKKTCERKAALKETLSKASTLPSTMIGRSGLFQPSKIIDSELGRLSQSHVSDGSDSGRFSCSDGSDTDSIGSLEISHSP